MQRVKLRYSVKSIFPPEDSRKKNKKPSPTYIPGKACDGKGSTKTFEGPSHEKLYTPSNS